MGGVVKRPNLHFGRNVLMTQLAEIKPIKCPEVKLRHFSDEINLWTSCSAAHAISLYCGILVEMPNFFFEEGKFDARW